MAVGAGVSMYGQYQAGKAAEASANFNAKMKKIEAKSEGEAAAAESQRMAMENVKAIAAGTVSAAGSGLSIDSGSVVDWSGDMTTANTQDTSMVWHNTRLKQFGLLAGASLDKSTGKNARTASYINMTSTAFSSVGQIGMGVGTARGMQAKPGAAAAAKGG
jgi:hypothetical protein